MINDTPDVICVDEDLEPAFHRAVDRTLEWLALPIHTGADTIRDRSRVNVASWFETNSARTPDVMMLQSLCEITTLRQTKSITPALDNIREYLRIPKRISVLSGNSFRSVVRVILFRMWADGSVLLPVSFKFFQTVNHDVAQTFTPELMSYCLTYDGQSDQKSYKTRVRNAVPRWLTATSWLEPEDVTIDEATHFNQFLCLCQDGQAGFDAPLLVPTVGLLLHAIIEDFPDRCGFTRDELAKFDMYFSGGFFRKGVSFREFGTVVADRVAKRKVDKSARRSAAARQAKADELEQMFANADDGLAVDHLQLLTRLRRESNKWFPDTSALSFIRRQFPRQYRQTWSVLFDGYVEHRKVAKGYESDKSVVGALRILADYLSVCLPIALTHSNPKALSPPSCPRLFTRFPWVDMRGKGGAHPTLLEYIRRRLQSVGSQYSTIVAIELFFSHIERTYDSESDAHIAGPTFKNPIWKSVDTPRTGGRFHGTTDKVPFSRHVVPHLLRTLYALEAFGMKVSGERMPERDQWTINTSEYRFVPVYWHKGSMYKLDTVPLKVIRSGNSADTVSLTQLRMIILALETGLRFQSVQWLCRLTFDALNSRSTENDSYFYLDVNTDKVHDGFQRPILPRVRKMLLRELADQERYGGKQEPIKYEGREHTRFEEMVPLFRNPETGQPYSDSSYARVWKHVLCWFQQHYSAIGSDTFAWVCKPSKIQQRVSPEGYPYCTLKAQVLQTPHSVRSTFATRYSPFIDLSDVAELLGHSGPEVTRIYVNPEYDELAERLLEAEKQVGSGARAQASIRGGPAYLDAQAVSKRLSEALQRDPARAVDELGFTSIWAISEMEDADLGLALLRSSPVAQIECADTHFCPVGGNCPDDVVRALGGTRRCGGCPLACKAIDHLPAISAKIRYLQEMISSSMIVYKKMLADPSKQGAIGEVYDLIERYTQEMLAWCVSEDILWRLRESGFSGQSYHAFEPAVVKQHLQRVAKKTTLQEKLLLRILDAKEYPSLETDTVRFQAASVKRWILANYRVPEHLAVLPRDDGDADDVEWTANFIGALLKARDLTLSELAGRIEGPPQVQLRRRLTSGG